VINPSAATSHRNQVMITILEFLKIKFKNQGCLGEIKKTKKVIFCDF
jgi:hypothetical protein